MASLPSLLGFQGPVLSYSTATARLSKDELRVASNAFHRARGYKQSLEYARFRDAVLLEAFPDMPPALAKRLFLVWNPSDTNEMTMKEFITAFALVTKGTREEHLRFVYQLMDVSSTQELRESDVEAFLPLVAPTTTSNTSTSPATVAIEVQQTATDSEVHEKAMDSNEFASWLFKTAGSSSGMIGPNKFVKALSASTFKQLLVVDWISAVATHFNSVFQQDHSISGTVSLRSSMTGAVGTPSAAQPLVQARQWSVATQAAVRQRVSELHQLVLSVEEVSPSTVRSYFTGVLDDDVLDVAWSTLCAWEDTEEKAADHFLVRDLAVCVCALHASDVDGMLRGLFALFDDDARGFLNFEQVARLVRLLSGSDLIDSERMALMVLTTTGDSSTYLTSPTSLTSTNLGSSVADTSQLQFSVHDMAKLVVTLAVPAFSLFELDLLFWMAHVRSCVARANREDFQVKDIVSQVAKATVQEHDIPTRGYCMVDATAAWYWCGVRAEDVCVVNSPAVSPSSVTSVPWSDDDSRLLSDPRLQRHTLVPMRVWLAFAIALEHSKRISGQPSDISRGWKQMAADALVTAMNTQGVMFELTVDYVDVVTDGSASKKLTMVAPTSCSIQGIASTVLSALHPGAKALGAPNCQHTFEAQLSFVVHWSKDERVLSISNEQTQVSLTKLADKYQLDSFRNTAEAHLSVRVERVVDEHESTLRALQLQLPDVPAATEWNPLNEPRLPRVGSIDSLASSTASTSSAAQSPRRLSRTRSARLTSAVSGWNNVHGLANLGNTCFMNSALQCLMATPLLRDYFLQGDYLLDISSRLTNSKVNTGPRSSSFRDKASKESKKRLLQSIRLPLAFGQLVSEMNAYSSNGVVSGVCDVVSPKHMKQTISKLFPHLSDGSQQDAQEFLSSLLNSLSEQLRREHVNTASSDVPNDGLAAVPTMLSPPATSRPTLARWPSFSRKSDIKDEVAKAAQKRKEQEQKQRRFKVEIKDSNGRPDEVVAMEWWIAHLLSEPSIITALFCGQLKGVLTCNQCGHSSARFEPFTSLQLPLLADSKEHDNDVDRGQQLNVVVILHFLESPAGRPLLRLALRCPKDATVETLLSQVRREYMGEAANHDDGRERQLLAVSLNGHMIEDYLHSDTLLMTAGSPIDVFELQAAGNVACDAGGESVETIKTGDAVWVPVGGSDRFVRGVISHINGLNEHDPRSDVPTQADETPLEVKVAEETQAASKSVTYDVLVTEGILTHKVLRSVQSVLPATIGITQALYVRFIHRRQVLVPFYCSTPCRDAVFGFPFVERLHDTTLTGRALYTLVARRFGVAMPVTPTTAASSAGPRPLFVLRRVRSDGLCCQRCHWTARCRGCIISSEQVDMLEHAEMDETIAIDWQLESDPNAGHSQVFEWLLQQESRIQDHSSYVGYREANAQTLERCLDIFCTSESLEATCSECKRRGESQQEEINQEENKQEENKQRETEYGKTTQEKVENEDAMQAAELPPKPTCAGVTVHTKDLMLWSMPPILVLQLKRFHMSSSGYAWQKLNHCIDFPLSNLDLRRYLSKADDAEPSADTSSIDDTSDSNEELLRACQFLQKELNIPLRTASRDCCSYNLYGIVNHTGELGSGHYTAHIRHAESGEWWLADDSTGSRVMNPHKLTPSSAAYLLFYVRQDIVAGIDGEGGPEEGNPATDATPKVYEFFPRQPCVAKLNDAMVKNLWRTDNWQRTVSQVAKRGIHALVPSDEDPCSSSSSRISLSGVPECGTSTRPRGRERRNSANCNFM